MGRVMLNMITSLKKSKFELYLNLNQVECWTDIIFTEQFSVCPPKIKFIKTGHKIFKIFFGKITF